jgi:hypothetical protein
MSHHCVEDMRMRLWPFQRGSRLAATIVGVGPAVPIGRRSSDKIRSFFAASLGAKTSQNHEIRPLSHLAPLPFLMDETLWNAAQAGLMENSCRSTGISTLPNPRAHVTPRRLRSAHPVYTPRRSQDPSQNWVNFTSVSIKALPPLTA